MVVIKMDYKRDFNVFVGGKLGILKGIKVEIIDDEWKGIAKNLQKVEVLNKDSEITAMSWGDSEESDIILGLANQTVKVYDTEYRGFTSSLDFKLGSGPICGVGRVKGTIFTAVKSGKIKVWAFQEERNCNIDTGGPLEKMKQCSTDGNIIATGGREKDLQQWDLETQKCTFTAKNVRHNELELREPVWVSDVDFLSSKNRMAVCSRFGYVRLYDSSTSQRRPVCNLKIPERVLTAICSVPSRENHVVVGSGTGHMMLVDLRGKGIISKHYKGSAGSIRSIVCHPSEPYIVSVGLDRHIKIHNLNNCRLLYKDYLRSRLNCVLVRKKFFMEKTSNESESDRDCVVVSDNVDHESKINDLFENMESIEEDPVPKKKKRRINS
ncbi:WD repeat-containing protein 74 [Anabrus simplex]|uniref:WD repeat-containing protein 74 n=1 Tax=Anabrus simplex TaxID=316456 RepID=UPI0035A36E12